jgi:DNA polymerase-3 subunit alpha
MYGGSTLIHLHVHSEYSLLDGMCRIGDIKELADEEGKGTGKYEPTSGMLKKCKDLGMNSVAITDHGVLYGVLDLYDKAKKVGIKPIIGIEVYCTEDRTVQTKKEIEELGYDTYHLVLLAKNQTGYKNLMKIVTDSYLKGFYSKPRTDLSVLREYNEGLICLSACVAGMLPAAILRGDQEKAEKLIQDHQEIFGEDFYLEVQANAMEEQKIVNEALADYSKKFNIPLVMTCDVHYLNRDDAFVHEVLLAAQTNQIVGSPKALKFSCNDFWFKSDEEIRATSLGLTEEEIDASISMTHKIADECDIQIEFGANLLPTFETPDGSSLESYLTRICEEALFDYYLEAGIDYYEYKKRLEYELSIINKAGFAGYFLIIKDFMGWGRDNGVMAGPGRGSAASSIVSFLLKITDRHIDPIKHHLPFERFLNPERKELPDVDMDFVPEDRLKIIEYIRQKYGAENVAQIGTLGEMAAKKALKKIGSALNINYLTMDEISKLIPTANELEEGESLNIKTAVKHSKELQRFKEVYPQLFEIAEVVEGLPSNTSIHAGGVVIAPRAITEYVPLQFGRDKEVVTQYTMDTIAQLGLVKMDILGVKTLNIIKETIEMAKERFDGVPRPEEIGVVDREPYEMLCNLETDGIFQVESDIFRRIIKDMQPKNFSEWSDLVALGRPGPLLSGMVESYCKRKKGEEEITYPHPALEPILKGTYGTYCYQEQIMRICQALAGYSMGEADKLRKIMGKKKAELLPEEERKFLARCKERGEDVEVCKKIWDDMANFAEYGFNYSHSACYALISYRTMWLKWKYPVEFFACILTNDCLADKEKCSIYTTRARQKGITILPPDINKSDFKFVVEDGKIRTGFVAIKGVGKKAPETIKALRPFTSFEDFEDKIQGKGINKKAVQALIYSGCFDEFEQNRNLLYKRYLELRADRKKPNKAEREEYSRILLTWTKRDIRHCEAELLGFPLLVIPRWEQCKEGETISFTGMVERIHRHTTKNGKPMAFVDLNTEDVIITCLLFEEQWLPVEETLARGQEIAVRGKKSQEKLIVKEIKYTEEEALETVL